MKVIIDMRLIFDIDKIKETLSLNPTKRIPLKKCVEIKGGIEKKNGG